MNFSHLRSAHLSSAAALLLRWFLLFP